MDVVYKSNLDDWIITQLFNLEQLTHLKKHDQRGSIKALAFFLMLGLLIYLSSREHAPLNFLIFFSPMCLVFFFLQSKKNKQKLIFNRLRIAYEHQFNTQKDFLVKWQTTPEQIIIQSWENEIRIPWSSVQKVTLCPQFLCINFGTMGLAALPKNNICQGEYETFTRHFVDCYQDYAARQNSLPSVIQSDWLIDVESIKNENAYKISLRRLGFSFLWWLVFLIGGVILFGGLTFGVLCVTSILDFEPNREGSFFYSIIMIFVIGSALTGLAGLALGLLEKLPGTKAKKLN
jgi:hypothetical protein